MGSYFRRCVALNPNPYAANSYLNDQTRAWVLASGAQWIRLWADWPSFQPAPDQLATYPGGPIDGIDRSIARAKADGLGVILTNYRFPRWANGTLNPTQADLDAWHPDRQTNSGLKAFEYRFPTDLTIGSPWYFFLYFLATRYSPANPSKPYGNAWVDVVEIVNEPTGQCWPQRGSTNFLSANCAVANMMIGASSVQSYAGVPPLMAGPATDDFTGSSSRARTHYHEFTDGLLDALQNNYQDNRYFVWTHHNYGDVLNQRNTTPTLMDKLLPRWGGYPSGVRNQGNDVWITESGGHVGRIRESAPTASQSQLELAQALRVEKNMDTLKAQGHLNMWTQYLSYSDPCYDTGFADALEPHGNCTLYEPLTGQIRQVWNVWSNKTRYGAGIY